MFSKKIFKNSCYLNVARIFTECSLKTSRKHQEESTRKYFHNVLRKHYGNKTEMFSEHSKNVILLAGEAVG